MTDLAKEIERQAHSKRDYVAQTGALSMRVEGDKSLALAIGSIEPVGINNVAHSQIATYAGVPAKYYERCRAEAPELLAQNVNHWLSKADDKRMVRVLDNKARALVSPSFRSLDNYDLAQVALPVIHDIGGLVLSAEITERRFYLKIVDERVTRDIPTGRKLGDGSHVFFDTVSPIAVLSNSEVGFGALSIESGWFTKMCTNIGTFSERSLKKYHVGSRTDIGDNIYQLLTDQTKKLTDAAVWHQVRDVLKGAFEEARFEASLAPLKGLAEQRIAGNPVEVVEVTAKRFGLNETEKGGVLKHLIEGGDLTRYGLLQAVTRTAEDVESYDRASEFERLGGQIIDLNPGDWEEIAKAA